MSVPIIPDKYREESLLRAADIIALKKRSGAINLTAPPPNVILCYQTSALAHVQKNYAPRKIKGWSAQVLSLKQNKNSTAIVGGFGLGAPAAVAMLEEFAAFGARRFVSIGWAGGLPSHLNEGDLVVCDRALRDEGASHHYLPDEKFAYPNGELAHILGRQLTTSAQPYVVGGSWTTDAPYRETRGEVESYTREGILTVEMEAAALFAAGQAIGVQVAAMFVIADTLGDAHWHGLSDSARVQKGLSVLMDAAIRALGE